MFTFQIRTTVYILDRSRSRTAPEAHPGESEGVLVVDRYSADKALSGVKNGRLTQACCWAHVRRDFIRVGKGWADQKEWALTWLGRIRVRYGLHRQRLGAPTNSDRQMALRDAVAAVRRRCLAELADPTLGIPARKVLTSLDEHGPGLTRFVDDPRIPLDSEECSARGEKWARTLESDLDGAEGRLDLGRIGRPE
ncbi:MAG: transposase [Gemmataceae bacterium]|nr:transposase [Gemmataceae bacterium]